MWESAAGWLFIENLEADRYHGMGLSPDILLAAYRTSVRGLQDVQPCLTFNATAGQGHHVFHEDQLPPANPDPAGRYHGLDKEFLRD